MRLLETLPNGDIRLTEDLQVGTIPPYAILSHIWGQDDQEVTFADMRAGTGQEKGGYKKIKFCSDQAKRDGLRYFWVDSCCINKENNAELSKAIRSMYEWYQAAVRCYVYMSDVSMKSTKKRRGDNEDTQLVWEHAFKASRWHTRGWTLQELLAPPSVEFFASDGQQLGDRVSLHQQIQHVTSIPASALKGIPLSSFTVSERMSWVVHRETKVEEDKAYSLLGIFGVSIIPMYGEGATNAFRRLQIEIDKLEQCMQVLYCTDPRKDKRRIVESKDGLLRDSYQWILSHSDFQQWRNQQRKEAPLLWIKGDPGKGKTMLLSGIIDELESANGQNYLLSYFYCQSTDSRLNNATAVLRGLLYLLLAQQPSLSSHIQQQIQITGHKLFEDANSWFSVSEIFMNIIQDPALQTSYLIIDALDECQVGLAGLLDLIARQSSTSSRVKWLVASRNWSSIEEGLDKAQNTRLSLELNADSISTAVRTYVKYKVDQLVQHKKLNDQVRDDVFDYLSANANDTFLWVALACQNLQEVKRWNILTKLRDFPPGLDALYKRMLDQIDKSDDAEFCKRILAMSVLVYRPVTIHEVTHLIDLPESVRNDPECLVEMISLCGSFLTIRNNTVYLVHQSAKDYILEEASSVVFSDGKEETHYQLSSRALDALFVTLKRDIYEIDTPGCLIKDVKVPDPDPLVGYHYSIVYWISHLVDWEFHPLADHDDSLSPIRMIDTFIRKKYLYWLEALSLCKSIKEGIAAMGKLEIILQTRTDETEAVKLVADARRFALYFRDAIQHSPLQIYVSGLFFSPTKSLVRQNFVEQQPKWVAISTHVPEDWSPSLATLEGHSEGVLSIAISPNGRRVASGSCDTTIRLWDSDTGTAVATLEGHHRGVRSVIFSPDGRLLASGGDSTIRLWDAETGAALVVLKTPRGYRGKPGSFAFSPDGTRMVSGSYFSVTISDTETGVVLMTLSKSHMSMAGCCVAFAPNGRRIASNSSLNNTGTLWDSNSGMTIATLKGHHARVISVAFSPNNRRLATGSTDQTIRLWDGDTGVAVAILDGHRASVRLIAFSPDSSRFVTGSDHRHGQSKRYIPKDDNALRLWDTETGARIATLDGHSQRSSSLTFSSEGRYIASGSCDSTIRLWDGHSGEALAMFQGHNSAVESVAFLPNSKRVASGSRDGTVKLWDGETSAIGTRIDGHSNQVNCISFSPNGSRVASGSYDNTIRLWDGKTGAAVATLIGHYRRITSISFSPDSNRLASASYEDDKTVGLWDTKMGALLAVLEGHRQRISSVAFLLGGKRILSWSYDSIKLWDGETGALVMTLEGCGGFTHVNFSAESRYVVSGSTDNRVRLWDAEIGTLVAMHADHNGQNDYKDHLDHIKYVTLLPGNRRVASWSTNGRVRLWEGNTSTVIATPRDSSNFHGCIAISPDGRRLAESTSGNTATLWNSEICEIAGVLEGHNGLIWSVAFSPDSRRVMTGSQDKTLRLWDAEKAAALATFEVGVCLRDLSFSDDGMTLYTHRGIIQLEDFNTDTKRLRERSGLFISEQWITLNLQKLIWLPPEYRATCVAVKDGRICLSHASGAVSFINFECSSTEYYDSMTSEGQAASRLQAPFHG